MATTDQHSDPSATEETKTTTTKTTTQEGSDAPQTEETKTVETGDDSDQ